MKNYKNLSVWQKSMNLVVKTYQDQSLFPMKKNLD